MVNVLFIILSLPIPPLPPQETQPAKKFNITPQAVTSPLFRYLLLPPLKDLQTGNAVQHYYRCMAPDAIYFYRDRFPDHFYAWLNLPYEQAARKGLPPAAQQPRKKVEEGEYEEPVPFTREEVSVLRAPGHVLNEIDKAARRTHAEWEYLERMKEHGMRLLLADVQGLRILGSLVQARARLALMDGDYQQALWHLQTGMAMGQHLNQARILVSSLVGLAIVKNMLKTIDEFIQTPKAPNLYWALTDLPQPLLDFRQAFAGDRLAIEYMLGDPKELEERIFTSEEMQALITKKLKPLLQMNHQGGNRDLTLIILKEYPRAKAWLLEQGRSAADVEKMTATQAVLLFARARFQVLADDFAKLFQLSLPERLTQAHAFTEKIKELASQQDASYFLGFYFYTHFPNVWVAVYDVDREIALLRSIELLRHYAAGHDRKLPENWDAVKDLPIPVDPVNGKRFGYQLRADHAVITLDAIPGSPIHRTAQVYEVHVK